MLCSSADCKLNKVGVRPEPRTPAAAPRYPEDLNQGLMRYCLALQEIGTSFAGRTVLVVTHGEVGDGLHDALYIV